MASTSTPHIALFPFMSKGHTIPILHLARFLLQRHTAVTIFTTPANRPFISQFLSHTHSNASIIELPFPENIDGIPKGVESTDKLPSMSLIIPFTNATKLIQPHLEQALETLLPVTCIISDSFLPWTLHTASKFGIPRLTFNGMSNYFMAVTRDLGVNGLLSRPNSDDDPITPINFPWIQVTRNDFDEPFNKRDPTGPHMDFIMEQIIATANSYGLIANSFYELEPLYLEYWNHESKPKAWCVGPLCLPESPSIELQLHQKPKWVEWLDQKLEQGCSVLYVAFGTQAAISSEQLGEIAMALKESNVNFLWLVRKNESELQGIDEALLERGMIVREWVDQKEILGHKCVQGFLSHCGWNSVLESICSKVPILAWPMMADQHLNARLVVEELKVGIRIDTCNGSVRGFVKWENLAKNVRELMVGEKGKDAREKVNEIGEAAKQAAVEGGSSWKALNQLIDEINALKADN